MKIIKGGVTAPKGFLANGLASGIKRSAVFSPRIRSRQHRLLSAWSILKKE
jgi:hypothetical protein